jgi:hypothetical protein
MPEKGDGDYGEKIDFPGGWKGLYLFLLVFGVLQIAILYIYTITYNRP